MASEVQHQSQAAHQWGNPDGVNETAPAPATGPQPARTPSIAGVDSHLNGGSAAARPQYGGLQPLFPEPSDTSDDEVPEPSRLLSPVTSPPYWVGAHGRSASSTSIESVLPAGAITLQDNENDDDDERAGSNEYGRHRNRACWAKSVEVTHFVVVNGSATNIGAFVVWNIRVETLNGSYMNIRKRYSEFDDLRRRLMQTFPNFEAAVPELPPKSVISKFRPRFLERRRAGLQYFLNCILLNPEFSGSPVLKDFLFS